MLFYQIHINIQKINVNYFVKYLINLRVIVLIINLCLRMHNLAFIIFFIVFGLSAQDSNTLYTKAISCYNNQDYNCSKKYLESCMNTNVLQKDFQMDYVHYYYFLSSLKLYNPNTEFLFKKFLKEFPLSSKKTDLIINMASFYFEKKKFSNVVDLLEEVNLYKVPKSIRNSVFFQLGYSAFSVEKFDLAKNSFFEIINSNDVVHIEDAIFYNAIIFEKENNYDDALVNLESLVESESYRSEAVYQKSKILYNNNQYSELVSFLEPIIDIVKKNHFESLILFLAKSYFHLNDYDKCVVYYDSYRSLVKEVSIQQIYQIGVSYYKKGLYGFAVDNLNKITDSANEKINQYVNYYLADSYKKIGDINSAINAFMSASLMDHDKEIKHDSYFNYILLSYEHQTNQSGLIFHINEFIKLYPNSKHVDELVSCLANIHLNSLDYDLAINVLQNNNLKNYDNLKQFQKVCFFKAVQLFNDAEHQSAEIYFKKSIETDIKNDLWFKANFWSAENYFELDIYNKAINSYNLSKEYPEFAFESLYGMGYAYLKINQQTNSINNFLDAVELTDNKRYIHDIYARVGDNFFELGNYDSASDFYTKSIKIGGIQSEYLIFRKAISLMLREKYDMAIKSLNLLISDYPQSNFIDEAIFKLGEIYMITKNFDLAISSFEKIINEFQNSNFYASSKLKLGLVYYMKNNDEKSINILEKLLIEFPNSLISEESLIILKNIYSDRGELNKFLDLIKNLNHDYSKSELDSTTFLSAELQFLKSNYVNSKAAFKNYLDYYPDGLFILEANYYLYRTHKELDEFSEALNHLDYIVSKSENKYTEESYSSLAEISFSLEKYISSEKYFEKLLNVSKTIDIKQKALLGLIESKFKLYKYQEIIMTIDNYYKDEIFSGKDFKRLKYIEAVSLYKVGSDKKALIKFKWLKNNSDGSLKAESYYNLALISYNLGKYDESQKFVFNLINELPSYKKWVNNSLLVLSKCYLKKGDIFQSRHVLDELKNKTDDTFLLDEIDSLLRNFDNEGSDTIK